MINLEFRSIKETDIPQMSILFKHVYIETYGVEGISKEFTHFINSQFSEENLLDQLHDSKYDFWLAAYRDNPIGVIKLDNKKRCPIREIEEPEIDKLYVLRKFYGYGVGQGLLEEALNSLRELKYPKCWLWAGVENKRAIRFYEKNGFVSIGTAYMHMETNSYENVVMTKEL